MTVGVADDCALVTATLHPDLVARVTRYYTASIHLTHVVKRIGWVAAQILPCLEQTCVVRLSRDDSYDACAIVKIIVHTYIYFGALLSCVLSKHTVAKNVLFHDIALTHIKSTN